MSNLTYHLVVLLLATVLGWGKALDTWWFPRITREDNPKLFWLVVAAQGAILIAFLTTGKSWDIR
jgi:hypothetical protein